MKKLLQPPATAPREPGGIIKSGEHEIARQPGDVNARLSDAGAIANRWKKYVGSARIVWSRLSDNELLQSEGQAGKLIGLVQERYAVSGEEAGRRVRNFLQQYKLPLA